VSPVKFAALVFFEEFNGANRGQRTESEVRAQGSGTGGKSIENLLLKSENLNCRFRLIELTAQREQSDIFNHQSTIINHKSGGMS